MKIGFAGVRKVEIQIINADFFDGNVGNEFTFFGISDTSVLVDGAFGNDKFTNIQKRMVEFRIDALKLILMNMLVKSFYDNMKIK